MTAKETIRRNILELLVNGIHKGHNSVILTNEIMQIIEPERVQPEEKWIYDKYSEDFFSLMKGAKPLNKQTDPKKQ